MAFSATQQFGVTMFPTDYSMQPVELAKAVEQRGLDSLFFPEHTHIPVSRDTPFPGGGDLPEMYWHTHDPFVALGAAAAVTERIKLGTGICLVIERDAITLAKECASLDMISNGRFILGIGAGWNREEMENHGADYTHRWAVVREKVLAMKTIWQQEEPEFHGEWVDFDPIWSKPKPVQRPHPPIHVGGTSPYGPRRAARYGDGWVPINGRGSMLDELPVLAAECEKQGRDVAEIELSLYAAPPDVAVAERHAEAGVHRFVFGLPPAGADVVLPLLDDYASIIDRVG